MRVWPETDGGCSAGQCDGGTTLTAMQCSHKMETNIYEAK